MSTRIVYQVTFDPVLPSNSTYYGLRNSLSIPNKAPNNPASLLDALEEDVRYYAEKYVNLNPGLRNETFYITSGVKFTSSTRVTLQRQFAINKGNFGKHIIYNNQATNCDYQCVDEGFNFDFPNSAYNNTPPDERFYTTYNDITVTLANVESKFVSDLSIGSSPYYYATLEHSRIEGTDNVSYSASTRYIYKNFLSTLPIPIATDITEGKDYYHEYLEPLTLAELAQQLKTTGSDKGALITANPIKSLKYIKSIINY